jgi:hypothetical protein
MNSTRIGVPTSKNRNDFAYAIREWRCIDGELTCLRVYVPYAKSSEQPDWLMVDGELLIRF